MLGGLGRDLEFLGTIELLFEMSTEVVIKVDAQRRVKKVIVYGCFKASENHDKLIHSLFFFPESEANSQKNFN